MPVLSFGAILRNPWAAITHQLPADSSLLLLRLAMVAAAYCRDREYLLMEAAREDLYTPPERTPDDNSPDVHEFNEARSLEADRRVGELRSLYAHIMRQRRKK
jgi:hypothetical protein